MQIDVRNTEEDYYLFFKQYYLKKDFIRRLLLLIVFSLFIATLKEANHQYVLSKILLGFFITALFLVVFFSLLPYTIAIIQYRKNLTTNSLTKPYTIIIKDECVDIIANNKITSWRWETLNKAGIIDRYLYFTLYANKFYLIPLISFTSDNEAINFLGLIRNNILKVKGDSKPKKIRSLYYWGIAGLIPNFGLIIGITLIIKGLIYKRSNLVLIGIIDMLMTPFFWLVIFPILLPTK